MLTTVTKRILIITTVIVVLIAIGTTPAYIVLRQGEEEVKTEPIPQLGSVVSPIQARQATIAELPRAALGIPEWEEATVPSDDPLVFYDLKDRPICYMFTIIVQEEYAGYMTISARTEFFPVFGYSAGEPPTQNIGKALEVARETLPSADPTPQLLFLFSDIADPYLAKFTSIDNPLSFVVVRLWSLWMVSKQELLAYQEALESMLKNPTPKAQSVWKGILRQNAGHQ